LGLETLLKDRSRGRKANFEFARYHRDAAVQVDFDGKASSRWESMPAVEMWQGVEEAVVKVVMGWLPDVQKGLEENEMNFACLGEELEEKTAKYHKQIKRKVKTAGFAEKASSPLYVFKAIEMLACHAVHEKVRATWIIALSIIAQNCAWS